MCFCLRFSRISWIFAWRAGMSSGWRSRCPVIAITSETAPGMGFSAGTQESTIQLARLVCATLVALMANRMRLAVVTTVSAPPGHPGDQASIGGAPSRAASFTAAGVNAPVVINKPLSALPTIAPRKSLISPGPTAFVALALKQHVEAHHGIDAGDTAPVNAAIATSTCGVYLRDAQLAQHTLRQSLESRRGQIGKDAVKL